MMQCFRFQRLLKSVSRTTNFSYNQSLKFRFHSNDLSSSKYFSSHHRRIANIIGIATVLAVCSLSHNEKQKEKALESYRDISYQDPNEAFPIDGKDPICIARDGPYAAIIVGAGTAGCTTAFFLSKWMKEQGLTGRVLLIDRGCDFTPEEGPNPKLEGWWETWGRFAEAHESIRLDGSPYPATATDHKGVGGCGVHDTRITFQLRQEQREQMSRDMGWSLEKLNTFYQTALDLMPMTRSIPVKEPFYDAVISALTDRSNPGDNPLPLVRLDGDEHKTGIVVNSIAEPSLAMYSNSEMRWASAFLLEKEVKPDNLVVLSHAPACRIVWDADASGGLRARGVEVLSRDGLTRVEIEVDACGEVLVTSGAIGAAGFLQRSGVGDRSTLSKLGIHAVIDNPEVGHGVDHIEVGVMYEWLPQWNDPSRDGPPRGGAMGWPLVIFSDFLPPTTSLPSSLPPPPSSLGISEYFEAHFGAGYAEPYTDFPSVVATPNCIQPDLSAGYRASITSTDPRESLTIVHAEQEKDWEAVAKGVYRVQAMFQLLQRRGLVGAQLLPPFQISSETASNPIEHRRTLDWIRENHWTVFHWACTCQAGIAGRVADEHFRLRRGSETSTFIVDNVRIGSAASLPQLSEANPHLTVTAFAVALGEEALQGIALRQGRPVTVPGEIVAARETVRSLRNKTKIRRTSEESPNLAEIVDKHASDWAKLNNKE